MAQVMIPDPLAGTGGVGSALHAASGEKVVLAAMSMSTVSGFVDLVSSLFASGSDALRNPDDDTYNDLLATFHEWALTSPAGDDVEGLFVNDPDFAQGIAQFPQELRWNVFDAWLQGFLNNPNSRGRKVVNVIAGLPRDVHLLADFCGRIRAAEIAAIQSHQEHGIADWKTAAWYAGFVFTRVTSGPRVQSDDPYLERAQKEYLRVYKLVFAVVPPKVKARMSHPLIPRHRADPSAAKKSITAATFNQNATIPIPKGWIGQQSNRTQARSESMSSGTKTAITVGGIVVGAGALGLLIWKVL